jgi:hypothetical protein
MAKFTLALVAALIVGSASAALADPKALQIPSSPSPVSGSTCSPRATWSDRPATCSMFWTK